MRSLCRLTIASALLAVACRAESLTSGDAYVRFDAAKSTWTCGTGLIEQRLELAKGKFHLAELLNRLTGTEFVNGAESGEFRFLLAGEEYTGDTGGYRLKDYQISRLPVPKASPGIDPGVSFVINLEHPLFLISLHYDIFASTPRTQLGMIRKWYSVTNRTPTTQPLTEISMNHLQLKPGGNQRLTLYHWQGGGSGQGTNQLVVETLDKTRSRTFYSMDGAPQYRADDIFSGSASHHPYFVIEDSKAGEGLFLGFNYLGPWSMHVWNPGDHEASAAFPVGSQLEQHTEPLKPGATFEAPNSFIGVYKGDLDSAGEQLQDWQATFKWDYTREKYLWTTSIYNGHWDDPSHKQNLPLHTQEMWRIAEICRRTGAHIAHEDDFWFDQRGRGVWEGIDWTGLVDYLRQSGIIFRLWMPPQHFAAGTRLDTDHKDWHLVPKIPGGITVWYNLGLCPAAQGAHDYMREFILNREKRYGTFYYRLDGWVQAPCRATNHDHPPGQPHVQQYRHYLQMLREVKAANAEMGLQGCNSGGEWANWDKIELVENQQPSDGGGPDDNYYLSYFWPVAKIMQWGGGSTHYNDEAAEDRLRRDVIFHQYLRNEGVLDRYMRVYHPKAEGAPSPHTYLEITDGTRTKAAIFQDALPKEEVVVYPKALLPDARYVVTFRFNTADTRTATGAGLMRQGIRFRTKEQRETILLNMDRAPGRGTDRTPPTTPAKAWLQAASYGGRTGVALRWSPSKDDSGLIAEYQITRDGKPLDRVAIGAFYFDASEGNGLSHKYEVLAVDGDGNRSAPTTAARQE